MARENVGSKREQIDADDVPAELPRREAQDRPKGGQAQSTVDSMHVGAPKKQDNSR